MKAVVITLITLINPPTNRVPMSVVPVPLYDSWNAVNEPLEFVGQ